MILCGTDLTPASRPALECAAAVARKLGAGLVLAHVVERPGTSQLQSAAEQLAQQGAELKRAFGVEVQTRAVGGVAERELVELIKSCDARLVVVAAEGSGKRSRRLGGVAERLCQVAEVPVLLARSAEALVRWSSGERPLSTLVGSGLGDASRSALAAVADWPDLALTVVHVAWPYGEHHRLGIEGPIPLDELRPEVQQRLLTDLGRWASDIRSLSPRSLRVLPGWGRIDSHLAQLARENEVDLLVVGSHQRNLAARAWHGSVSRNALHEATCNVLCVPQRYVPIAIAAAPRLVVVPTDMSAMSDRAIAVGYSLLGRGGTVNLITVGTGLSDVRRAELLAQLKARIPHAAAERGIATELSVLEGDEPWLSVWQHASRSGADLVCMATRSRDAARTLLLGSQAQALLQHSRIPVLLVPPDRET
jgi:nucleotide-binding universal stress UspA family protein